MSGTVYAISLLYYILYMYINKQKRQLDVSHYIINSQA